MAKRTFKKYERLNNRAEIDALFRKGKRINGGDIGLKYMESMSDRTDSIMVLITVPKRNFKKAVDRNLLKRRMREAFRIHKDEIFENLDLENKGVNLMLSYQTNNILTFAEIENKIVLLLKDFLKTYEKSR